MFEFLKSFETSKNRIEMGCTVVWRVSRNDIEQLRASLPYPIPSQLLALYEEVGIGVFCRGSSGQKSISHNTIIPPNEVLSVLDGTSELVLPYTQLQPDTLPFFDRDLDSFLCFHSKSENPNAVHWMWGEKICDSLIEFIQRLVEDPDWFNPPKL